MAEISPEARSTLLKGLLFVVPLSAGFVAMELGLHRMAAQLSGRAQLEAQQARCQVLVLGSSNAEYGIVAKSLAEPSVNVAGITQSLYYDLALAERYVPRMDRLKVVVLPLTYVTFESESYDWQAWDAWPRYVHYWNISPQRAPFFDAQRWSLTAFYGLRMSISYARKGFRVSGPETSSAKPMSVEASDGLGALCAKQHENVIHPERAPDNLARLDRLAALVGQHGARLVLVDTPAQDNYVRRLSGAVLARNAQHRTQFLERHPNVMYRDYLRDPRFVAEDFRDPVHLTLQGAEKFTKILDAELVQPAQLRP